MTATSMHCSQQLHNLSINSLNNLLKLHASVPGAQLNFVAIVALVALPQTHKRNVVVPQPVSASTKCTLPLLQHFARLLTFLLLQLQLPPQLLVLSLRIEQLSY